MLFFIKHFGYDYDTRLVPAHEQWSADEIMKVSSFLGVVKNMFLMPQVAVVKHFNKHSC